MLSLPLLQRPQARAPLSEKRIHRILRNAGYSTSYRFEAVFAIDQHGQHYYVCHRAQLSTLTARQFTAALKLALSFRLPEAGY